MYCMCMPGLNIIMNSQQNSIRTANDNDLDHAARHVQLGLLVEYRFENGKGIAGRKVAALRKVAETKEMQ